MEFYPSLCSLGYDGNRFNSQRDGIFYASHQSSLKIAITRFNSQRDGILRTWLNYLGRLVKSFNSQRDGILLTADRIRFSKQNVSIPNGMEFYSKNFIFILLLSPFQFPTGWNSTFALALRSRPFSFVSIPNGMEFYRANSSA